ncbi:hypothetical protein [Roseateles sp. P5_D6]
MWFVVMRPARPDAPYWTGRQCLSAIDAVVWPAAWILALAKIPAATGVFGPTMIAVCVLAAFSRLHRAICLNNRYWFTTWKWGRIVFSVWLAGLVLKAAIALSA